MIDSLFESDFQTFAFFILISNALSLSTFADLLSLEKEHKIDRTLLRWL